VRLAWLTLLVACSSSDGASDQADRPAPPKPDAAVAVAEPVAQPRFDDPVAPDVPSTSPRTRERRTIQIMLASSPSGALAKVDGAVVGRTPAYWEGDFTGRERVFTFEIPGYTTAIYRFVPIQNGFVHGKLEKIENVIDAGHVGE
jgi:hypothetical protein